MSREHHAYFFSEGGIRCPLCGGRMARGAYFCGRCRRAGRFHVDSHGTKAESKHIYLPRGLIRFMD